MVSVRAPTRHLVAHAADIDDHRVERDLVEPAGELADHGAALSRGDQRFEPPPRARMGVGDGDGERVGGIGAVERRARQQAFHHGADLALVAVTGADHGLLHRVRRVFGDLKPEQRRHEQGDAPRLAELQRGGGVAIDEGLLDRRFLRAKAAPAPPGGRRRSGEARAPRLSPVVGDDRAAGDENEPHPVAVDHPPAGAPQPRVDADDANPGRSLGQSRCRIGFPHPVPNSRRITRRFCHENGVSAADSRNGASDFALGISGVD